MLCHGLKDCVFQNRGPHPTCLPQREQKTVDFCSDSLQSALGFASRAGQRLRQVSEGLWQPGLLQSSAALALIKAARLADFL